MKKHLSILLVTLLLISQFTTVFAHSGRTDAYGGHRDNNNVSGLGYYHYHHGYPAHLHPNGVCPYASNTTNNTHTYNYNSQPSTPAPSKEVIPPIEYNEEEAIKSQEEIKELFNTYFSNEKIIVVQTAHLSNYEAYASFSVVTDYADWDFENVWTYNYNKDTNKYHSYSAYFTYTANDNSCTFDLTTNCNEGYVIITQGELTAK